MRRGGEGEGEPPKKDSTPHAPLPGPYLGEELSLFRVLRWKSEGARHTARLVGVIWFSFTAAVTSLRK